MNINPGEKITDRETLRQALQSNEMSPYVDKDRNINDGYNLELSSNNEEDEYRRKTTLLERKTKILQATTVQTHNNFMQIFNISCILSISGLQFGYGICEITTIWNHDQLIQIYGFPKTQGGLWLGLMVGFMPLGATFGSIAARQYLKFMKRKTAHFVNNIICMVSSFCIMQFNYPETILIGRFIYGWTIACYCSWSPLVIRQIAPVNLRPLMGSVFSIGRVFSIVFGYLFGLIFYLANVPSYYRIMFCIPGAMALIQLILMIPFVPDSPTQLFERQDYVKGRQVLELIYKPQFVDMMFDKFKLQADVTVLKIQSKGKIDPYPELKNNMLRAMAMGVHLNIFRQFLGLNTLVSYAGIIMSKTSPQIGPYTNFFVNGIELIATLIATFWVADRFGRRFLLMYSVTLFTICNFLIVLGLLISQGIFTLVFMIILMGTFGIAYSVVSWAYPAQILRPDQVPYASLTTWPALAITTIFPPIIAEMTADKTPWPVFLFYGVYCAASWFYMWFCVIESKGRQYVDIIKQF